MTYLSFYHSCFRTVEQIHSRPSGMIKHILASLFFILILPRHIKSKVTVRYHNKQLKNHLKQQNRLNLRGMFLNDGGNLNIETK